MSDHYEEIAQKLVGDFKASLGKDLIKQIPSAQFDTLTASIRGALSAERAKVADEIEGVVKKLRSKVDRLELEL
jgi:hypothetical protein